MQMVYKHRTFIPTNMKVENNLVTECSTEAWPITIQSIQSIHKQNSGYKQGNEHSEKFTSPEIPIHNANGLQAPNIYSYKYEGGK